jgi:hypothetical protein
MVGGLIVSQAMTLFTTPVVYLYLDRLANRRRRSAARARTPEEAVARALAASEKTHRLGPAEPEGGAA